METVPHPLNQHDQTLALELYIIGGQSPCPIQGDYILPKVSTRQFKKDKSKLL